MQQDYKQTTTTTTSISEGIAAKNVTEKVQPQPYPLQGQSLATGWGQYPQGAYYPPPVQKPQEVMRQEFVAVAPSQFTTTEIIDVQTIPLTTVTTSTFSTGSLSPYIGVNSHGVPQNFLRISADASCHKCHGTGYKKGMLTRKWKACKKCSRKYNTDVSKLSFKEEIIGTAAPVMATSYVSAMPMTTTEYVRPVISNVKLLPAGFQTLPANPQCVKCEGLGYHQQMDQWQGCQICANQYGTNLKNVVLPSTINTVPMASTGNIFY